MKNAPTNTDDVIDSRDVIERLEELEAMRKPFAAGWNMPGYMPDNEPAAFETWEDAAEYIKSEIQRAFDEIESPAEDEMADFESITQDAENSDAARGFGRTYRDYHYWITESESPFEDPDDAAEYDELEAFTKDFENYSAGYSHGEIAIRDSYFKQYAMELADDIGAIPDKLAWPCTCIDWERASHELKSDYTAIEFGNVTYWVR